MEKFVLDTNLFFNMQASLGMGKKTEEVIITITSKIRRLERKRKAVFYMSPRIVDELLSFFENKEQLFIKDFLSVIKIKSPEVSNIQFPASVFYSLIDDIRSRSYRGLNIAEEEIKKTGKMMIGVNLLNKKDFEIKIGGTIKSLRERYRQATRLGFLDSIADLDLIVLAKEIDGFLVSSDIGLIDWARRFGVKEIPVAVFGKRLEVLEIS